jgi:hypothetical protein
MQGREMTVDQYLYALDAIAFIVNNETDKDYKKAKQSSHLFSLLQNHQTTISKVHSQTSLSNII